jgi:hypothetical protein
MVSVPTGSTAAIRARASSVVTTRKNDFTATGVAVASAFFFPLAFRERVGVRAVARRRERFTALGNESLLVGAILVIALAASQTGR